MKTEDLKLEEQIRCDPDAAYDFACRYLVAGLTSPGRRRAELDGHAFLVSRGEGAYLYDLRGQKYVDLNAGHGGALVGHSHPAIKAALLEGIQMGILCGQETVIPSLVAQRITEMVPCAERVRLMFTGTEATALAVRIARGFTGKLKIVKFEGHYHGQNDALQFNLWPPLDQAGPRSSPVVIGESAGLTPEAAGYISILPWNDLELLEDLLKIEGDQIAAVIMEPINYNCGGILPRPGYLEGVRALTQRYGIVLIFDEILSGFRTGPDCAQGYLGVTPDLTTLGKALGGGLPIAAVVGRKDVMETLAPVGRVSNQGTYYGQVLVMHAAKAFLDLAADPSNWAYQEKLGQRLYKGLDDLFARYGAGRIQAVGNRFGMFFGLDEPVWEYRQAALVDHELEFRFYKATFHHGVYFMHSWHHGYSWAHTEKDLDDALEGIEASLREAVKK
jgi:glutamate-1-semialdehyde 2,1-aminomutase